MVRLSCGLKSAYWLIFSPRAVSAAVEGRSWLKPIAPEADTAHWLKRLSERTMA